MALTLTEKFRGGVGGRTMVCYDITHDEATSTIAAASIGLTYIDYYQHAYQVLTSAPANTSITARYLTMSINATRSQLTITQPPKAASRSSLTVIGW